MKSKERGPHEEGTEGHEHEQLIERYQESLAALHRFSDTIRDLPPSSGDPFKGTRYLVLDLCAAIETILDHDLTRLTNREDAPINMGGEPYNPDEAALSTLEGVALRLSKRVEALKREKGGEPS